VVSLNSSSVDFGAVPTGTTKDLTITVQNSGGGTLSGSATTASPFSIVSGRAYNLASNQSQVVTIRYVPTQAGTDSATVNFSGGGGASASLNGFGVTIQPTLSWKSAAGTIAQPFIVVGKNTILQSIGYSLDCS